MKTANKTYVSRRFGHRVPSSVLLLNPRPAGGGGAESAPRLPKFRDNSKTVADINTKFGVPYPKYI